MEAEAAGGASGIYPVDILEDDPERHREATVGYYATLGEGRRSSVEVFSLPTGEQINLEASSVRFCTVYRDEPQHKILALVNPQDTETVVAVYIKESWWATEDVLRTSDPAREGLMKVQSFGERIVLFILNVVIFGRLERNLDDGDMFFLPHSVKEQAKILWQDGAAVGFYTTKKKGSLCGDGTGACYLLPVFDTVFVRRTYRRRGLGTAMLRDFCETFREDEALGISWPISPAMFQGQHTQEIPRRTCAVMGGLLQTMDPASVVVKEARRRGPPENGNRRRSVKSAEGTKKQRGGWASPRGRAGQEGSQEDRAGCRPGGGVPEDACAAQLLTPRREALLGPRGRGCESCPCPSALLWPELASVPALSSCKERATHGP